MGRIIKKKVTEKPPRAMVLENKKSVFIEVLQTSGGNASQAMLAAKLPRETAYRHFKEDPEFARQWLEALEVSNDSLFTEARRRAVDGVDEPVFHNGQKIAAVKKYSDTLLIFLLKQSEAQKKWRNRIVQTGNLAISVVANRGSMIGLTPEQIEDLQLAMTEEFKGVSLV